VGNRRLEALIEPRRIARLDDVLSRRTRNLTLLLEDLYDPHNASACLRSAEAFGLQDIYVVEAENRFTPNQRVVQGAQQWLDLFRFEDTGSCLNALRARGYRIYASDLAATCSLESLDFTQPTALAFGAEHSGASSALLRGADATFRIPMRGFSQSFNVSVAVALCLYHAITERTRLLGPAGDLSPGEREVLRDRWLEVALKRGETIARTLRRGRDTV